MWNSCESHIPLNGCKGTNFSPIMQIFRSFFNKERGDQVRS